jgi:hypothetical protein
LPGANWLVIAHLTTREGCYRDRVLGAGWTEVVALATAFVIAVLGHARGDLRGGAAAPIRVELLPGARVFDLVDMITSRTT